MGEWKNRVIFSFYPRRGQESRLVQSNGGALRDVTDVRGTALGWDDIDGTSVLGWDDIDGTSVPVPESDRESFVEGLLEEAEADEVLCL